MKLVLIGIQGSGKSTQGNILSRQLKIPYLSTGHIFRELAKELTTLGRYVKETMNAGLLIPDEKTIEIVNSYISRPEYGKGYILDGFPRTVTQAEKFKNNVDKVIFLRIPEKEALWRLLHRNDATRADDTLPALKKRIDSFNKFTKPVLDYYEKEEKLVTIDGTQNVEAVNDEILKSVGKQVIKNQVESWKRKSKTIIAIVGLPGSGKTIAAEYLKNKGIPVIAFGKIINDMIERKKLSHTEAMHKELRESIRKEHGIAAMAILNEHKIKEALKKNSMIVIDGIRSWEEYMYLKNQFPETRITIIALYTDKQLRYKRLAKRPERSGLSGENRDVNELIGINMGPTIAFADYTVKNNFSIEDLYDKLEVVYRTIYFS